MQLFKSAGLAFAAQGISSLTNFAVNALALTAGTLGEYGRFSIVFQICIIIVAAGQGGPGSAALIHGSVEADESSSRSLQSGLARGALIFGLLVAALLLVASLFVAGDLRTLLLLAALGAPALISQYTYRSVLFSQGRQSGVVVIDSVWFGVVAVAALVDWVSAIDLEPSHYLAVWLAGAAVSAAPLLLTALRGSNADLRRFWKTTGPQAVRTGVDSVLARSILVVALIAVGVALGDDAAGSLAAATLVFSPLSVVNAAIPAIVVPREIRRFGIHKVRMSVAAAVVAIAGAITLVWAGTVLLAQQVDVNLGPFDLSASAVGAGLFAATLLRFIAFAVWEGSMIALRIADAARQSLQARMVGTLAQWSLPVLALLAGSGVELAAFGLGAATMMGAIYSWITYRRLDPTPEKPAGATASG